MERASNKVNPSTSLNNYNTTTKFVAIIEFQMRELGSPFVIYVLLVVDFLELLSATAQTARRKFSLTANHNKGTVYSTITSFVFDWQRNSK